MKVSLPLRGRRPAVLIGAFLALACLAGCIKVPKLEDAMANARHVPETSKIYAADGSLITTLHAEENRENVPLSQMPKVVRDAVIAIEDQRFYQHPGVDVRAILRAFFKNTNSGHVVEGGSTITQQYVKNVLLDPSRTLKRKLTEAALAYQLEKKFSKDQILETYLNTVYFGEGAYGIEAASEAFFSVHAAKLNLPQSALLAGLIKSPASYDPLQDRDVALDRRNVVLKEMLAQGYISQGTHDWARAQPIVLHPAPKSTHYPDAYFVEYVKQLIEKDPRFSTLGSTVSERVNSLFKGGLRIYTTIDPKMQQYADAASAQVLNRPDDPHNALVSVDPDTGGVKAMVGGRDFFSTRDPYAKFNLATQSRRQPGSSFKPFTLAAFLESGGSLDKVYRGGSQVTISLGNGQYWSPKNYESLSFGSSLTVREATVKSVNVVYAQMVRDIGPEKVVEMAKRLGITSPLDPVYAIALGTEEVSPLEMAGAYSAFANGGFKVETNGITKITDSTGHIKYQWRPTKTQVLKPRVEKQVLEVMQDVVKYGTGTRERLPGRQVAGKTGTAEEYHDAWFGGYTRQLVTISWVGFPKAQIPMYPPYTRIRVVGGSWPGQIWKLFMENSLADQPALPFDVPNGSTQTVTVAIDVSRNCLPNKFTPPNVVSYVQFDKGSEPTQVCAEPSAPVPVNVPRVVGRGESDARSILQSAGLRVRSVNGTCPKPAGDVCSQFPVGGAATTAGQFVTITVSSQAAGGIVPAVLGEGRQTAINELRNQGFTVDYRFVKNGTQAVPGCHSATVAADHVWGQSRCGGEHVAGGSHVILYVNPIG